MVLNSYKYGYQVQCKCTRLMTTINNELGNKAIYGCSSSDLCFLNRANIHIYIVYF